MADAVEQEVVEIDLALLEGEIQKKAPGTEPFRFSSAVCGADEADRAR